MSLTHVDLREKFAEFWLGNEHKHVSPVSLVPENDPTTLFTGSGMQPLVPYLLGEPHPQGKKLFNVQPCFRAQDIEEVGDNRHTTFFEMMGNWSLGTYFKKEQLEWCWKFFTEELKLPKEKLWVTVFKGDESIPADEESYEVWKKLGVPENRIHKYGAEHNWWSRAGTPENMPAGEPGGPDSEVFYEFDSVKHDKKFGSDCHPNCECGRFLEVGNSVFMQYKKEGDGTFSELPNKNVDFGAGLERVLAAVNNTPDMFQTDVFAEIVKEIEKQSNKSYSELENQPYIRVVADHLKAATFLIADGIRPSNKEHGYVLRRLIRRSVVKMKKLKVDPTQLEPKIILTVLKTYSNVYFEDTKSDEITVILGEEVNKFINTLNKGMRLLERQEKINGELLFDLFQSYGFPLEVSQEIIEENGIKFTGELKSEFDKAREKHRELSKTSTAGKFKGGLADQGEQTVKYHTATHLIHQALYDVLTNVRQEGSNITAERLRFDFYSEKKPTEEEIKKVEEIVNQKIKEALPVRFEMMPKEEANKIGARSFFKEKYGAQVKVYFVGDYSKEFCGGPHVENSNQIGKISIYQFKKIGSNLYRIYAKTQTLS